MSTSYSNTCFKILRDNVIKPHTLSEDLGKNGYWKRDALAYAIIAKDSTLSLCNEGGQTSKWIVNLEVT